MVTGTEQYVAGTQSVMTKLMVKIGTEQVALASQPARTGTELGEEVLERKLVGLERMAAVPSLGGGGVPGKLPTSVVDVIAGVVRFRDSQFGLANPRSAYDFSSASDEDGASRIEPTSTRRDEVAPSQRASASATSTRERAGTPAASARE